MNNSSKIINPVTCNKDFTILRRISSRKIQDGYEKIFNIKVAKYFHNINTVYLCKCNKTGYLFFYPFTICGDEDFYKSLQNFDWYYQSEKWEFKLSRKLIHKGDLLEIGCGEGDFMNSLKGNKYIKTKGIEFNSKAINICRTKNLDVENYKLHELPSNSFDYLVSFQVLEHISDVKYFFENSHRLLRKGGKLIIGVPNTSSFVFFPFSNYYFQHGSLLLNMPPHHVGWWSKSSLKDVAKLFDFQVEDFYFEQLPAFRRDLASINLSHYFKIRPLYKIFILLLNKYVIKTFKGETLLAVIEKK